MSKQIRSFHLAPIPDKNHPKRVFLYLIGALLLIFIGGYIGYLWGINNNQTSQNAPIIFLLKSTPKEHTSK